MEELFWIALVVVGVFALPIILAVVALNKAEKVSRELFKLRSEISLLRTSTALQASPAASPEPSTEAADAPPAAEVETVQKVLQSYLGEEISSADVRVASKSAIYESAPLEEYVSRIGPKLPKEQRLKLIAALVEVLRADEKVASAEADYFNMICEALQMSFADVAGLTSD